MEHKGICYDVGTVFANNRSTRADFDPAIVRRELEVIKNDLHCTAIRLCGQDLGRLTTAAEYALAQGLAVWFSPLLVDATIPDTLVYLAECAKAAEKLRQANPALVFIVGGEASFYMEGIIEGQNTYARIENFVRPRNLLWHLLSGKRWPGNKLNAYLEKAVKVVREHFKGRVTYASGPWERVDWRLLDIVSVNYYRDAQNAATYRQGLQDYYKAGKPVAITEFGACTYEGAETKGAAGWGVVDTSGPRRKIKPGVKRSEATQAHYDQELLDIFAEEPLEASFLFTFVNYNLPYDPDPQFDLDVASYSIVKVLPKGVTGKTYAGMPWDLKEAFKTVANHPAQAAG